MNLETQNNVYLAIPYITSIYLRVRIRHEKTEAQFCDRTCFLLKLAQDK